jgi:RecB family endonuclease NucS
MKYVDNQVDIEYGRIDILAKDKNDILCIIELKVDNDCKDIVFQCAYYITQFKEETKRMITIAPDYSYRIKNALKMLPYVETYVYTDILYGNKTSTIKSLAIKQYNINS